VKTIKLQINSSVDSLRGEMKVRMDQNVKSIDNLSKQMEVMASNQKEMMAEIAKIKKE
jgi:hypothetical protein